MEDVLIGFGSNQGDSEAVCKAAIQSLNEQLGISIVRVSSFYRTAPVGYLDQDWFVNGVLLCTTTLTPEELLQTLHAIERSFGRERVIRWGPRTLDLDLLAFGDRVLQAPGLAVPHARMHERRFVLAPLAEIDPDWMHPVLRKTARQLLDELPGEDGQVVEPMGLR